MSEDKRLTELVTALTKFLQWQDEYDLVMSHTGPDDAAHRLMVVLGIPTDDVRVLIGGSNCPIFQRAADEIERLRKFKPRWMDRPDEPGVWYCESDDGRPCTSSYFSQADLNRGAPFCTLRVYGPIPDYQVTR